MAPKASRYIWQRADWPQLHFDLAAASPALLRARELQGQVHGMARAIGLPELQTSLIRPSGWMTPIRAVL